MAFSYLKVKSAKSLCLLPVVLVLVLLFWSWYWFWSCKQPSWSCYFGLGLKNLILFTSPEKVPMRGEERVSMRSDTPLIRRAGTQRQSFLGPRYPLPRLTYLLTYLLPLPISTPRLKMWTTFYFYCNFSRSRPNFYNFSLLN